MKSIFIMLFPVLCCQTTMAKHAIDVPEKVTNAFSKAYATTEKAKWELEDDKYEVSFVYQSKKMSVVYTKEGVATETETGIAISALPESARNYAAAKGKIKDAALIVKADGTVIYEAEVKGNDLLFDANGSYLRKQKD